MFLGDVGLGRVIQMAEPRSSDPRAGIPEAKRLIREALSSRAKKLNLSQLGLERVPDELAGLTWLEDLDLSSNNIREISCSITSLSNLQSLDLTDNQLKKLNPGLVGLRFLQRLYLHGNSSLELEARILGARHYSEAQSNSMLRANLIREKAIGGNAEAMKLAEKELAETAAISARAILREYTKSLRGLDKARWEVAWCQREHVRNLDLSNLELQEIPAEVGDLLWLEILNLSDNLLPYIPRVVFQLKNLVKINIDRNQLSEIAELLPSKLVNLVELRASGNNIEKLPPNIGAISRLGSLGLSKNRLQEIPDSIGGLRCLGELDLSQNKIVNIPDSIGDLENLAILNLNDNELTSLPDGLLRLTRLKQLQLQGNPELKLPPEIIGGSRASSGNVAEGKFQNPASILDYWFRIRESKRPINEVKLILVGFGNVGKTSIVKRLIDNRFDHNEYKTEGISIRDWGMTIGEDLVNVHIWDFGGQEIMHSTHQFFLTHRSLYLIVLNGRDDRQDADA